MILVTGATGNVGAELIRLLLAQGAAVRALTRDAARARLPGGIELCAADLSDAVSLRTACSGVHTAFMLAHIPGDPNQAGNFLRAARAAHVRRLVVLSSLSVEALIAGDPIGEGHRQLEQEVQRSGLPATFLRPGTFMSNAMFWAEQVRTQDVVRGMYCAPAAAIDPADVAAVAAVALSSDEHEGRVYALTGPERIASDEQVRVLGEVLGRSLRFEALAVEAVRHWIQGSLGGRGDPDAVLESVTSPTVPWAQPRPTVREITGHAPRTFRQWAQAHVEAFR